jgi:hypothetical protein
MEFFLFLQASHIFYIDDFLQQIHFSYARCYFRRFRLSSQIPRALPKRQPSAAFHPPPPTH